MFLVMFLILQFPNAKVQKTNIHPPFRKMAWWREDSQGINTNADFWKLMALRFILLSFCHFSNKIFEFFLKTPVLLCTSPTKHMIPTHFWPCWLLLPAVSASQVPGIPGELKPTESKNPGPPKLGGSWFRWTHSLRVPAADHSSRLS